MAGASPGKKRILQAIAGYYGSRTPESYRAIQAAIDARKAKPQPASRLLPPSGSDRSGW